MRAVILQPGYCPWIGYFDQMNRADVFVIYDDIQFDKNGWRKRNRIKTAQGIQWITVPVLTKGKEFILVKDMLINNDMNWQDKHLKTIKQNYSRAAYFKDYVALFEDIYARDWKYLIDLDMEFINAFNKELGIGTTIKFASELGIRGGKIERLINICHLFKATEFLEGSAGRDYIDDNMFTQAGIKIQYQDYKHPVYRQLYGAFIPYLSIIDLLFNEGKNSLNILSNIPM